MLSAADVAAIRADFDALERSGQLKPVECQAKARIRNDRIGWVGAEAELPALHAARRLLRALPAEIERRAGWRLKVPQEVMAACYPGSEAAPGSYMKHFDRGSKGNPRALTAILYLNAGWDASRDGGMLRAYLPGRGGEYRDVEPRGGRLLLFDSCTVEHEVRPCFAPRRALTLWASRADGGTERRRDP